MAFTVGANAPLSHCLRISNVDCGCPPRLNHRFHPLAIGPALSVKNPGAGFCAGVLAGKVKASTVLKGFCPDGCTTTLAAFCCVTCATSNKKISRPSAFSEHTYSVQNDTSGRLRTPPGRLGKPASLQPAGFFFLWVRNMRDIRGDLEERANHCQEQISAHAGDNRHRHGRRSSNFRRLCK